MWCWWCHRRWVDAVDGLRRAFGDPALERVAPHVTLVPPVNVAERDLVEVLAILRRAAGQARPLELTLGPVAAFEGHERWRTSRWAAPSRPWPRWSSCGGGC